MPIHNKPDACLSAFCGRDSPLFITCFINLNANWFCKGLSDWGPTPVLSRWLCVCACVCVCFVHLLDPGVTRPDSAASPACLSASSVALIRFECCEPERQVLHQKKKRKRQNKIECKAPTTRPAGCSHGLWGEKVQQMWIMAVRKLYGAGWWWWGQLNDPCSVARRHRGWMVEINAGIHPRWRAEGGKGREGRWGVRVAKKGRV